MSRTERSIGQGERHNGQESRQRQALVGVRLNPEELATLRTVAARDGKTLASALRDGFLRQAAAGR